MNGKKLCLCLLAMLTCGISFAQNLIPNPGFENYSNCPSNISEIAHSHGPNTGTPSVTDWENPLKTTADYFNSCAGSGTGVNIPNTYWDVHNTHSGNGCAGFFLFLGYNYHEYLECKLVSPLVAGHVYELSFYVSASSNLPNHTFGHANVVGTDQVAAHFSTTEVYDLTASTLNITADIINPGVIVTDTLNWINIKGKYKATGGEQWLVFGCLNNDSATIPLQVILPGSGQNLCYEFIDDVSLFDLTKPVVRDTFYSGRNDTLCQSIFPIQINPQNPINGSYLWSTGDTTAAIKINSGGIYWRYTNIDTLTYIDTIKVTAIQNPLVEINYDKKPLSCKNRSVQLFASGANSYSWSPGIYCDDSLSASPIVSLPFAVIFNVTGTSQWGCTSAAQAEVLYENNASYFFVPNAFTPNGDGKNDKIHPLISCDITFDGFFIYDKWGERVFISYSLLNGWDGLYHGVPMEIGTYFYYVKGHTYSGEPIIKKGSFDLVR